MLYLAGPNTFVPLGWMCKKQSAVSHSTAEAEIISMDASVRMEGLPCLGLWDLVIRVLAPHADVKQQKLPQIKREGENKPRDINLIPMDYQILRDVDYVPPSITPTPKRAELII